MGYNNVQRVIGVHRVQWGTYGTVGYSRVQRVRWGAVGYRRYSGVQ